ncbi:MAG: CpXC domain-containing protein [Clostridia bacterium]|nr:CpXC domain-containing protein [Clostridia bacterium]
MSLSESHKIKCTECGNGFEINEWNSINVEDLPELREKTISGEIFKFTCPKCKKEQIIIYDCLYFDRANKFMVQLLPEYPNKEYLFSAEEAKVITTFGNNIYRLATDYASFLEKVRVLSLGLNDKAVEICKSLAYSTYTINNNEIPENAFFVKCDEKVMAFQMMLKDKKPKFMSIPMEFYNKVKLNLVNSPLSKESFSIRKIDLKWALTEDVSKFLKELQK